MTVAYAHNNYWDVISIGDTNKTAQKEPYLPGRLNVVSKLAIPHITASEQNGTVAQAAYGLGPVIFREEGQGNGGNFLELTKESVDEIMSKAIGDAPVRRISYLGGKGPVNIKVVDPLNVPDADFELKVFPQDSSMVDGLAAKLVNADDKMRHAKWVLNKMKDGVVEESVTSEQAIFIANEQIIPQWGLSVTAAQVENPGSNSTLDNNGYIGSSITFGGNKQIWLEGFKDEGFGSPYSNWIRSGTANNPKASDWKYPTPLFNDWTGMDDGQNYENVVGGTWAPYRLTSAEPYGPMINSSFTNLYFTGASSICGTDANFKGSLTNRMQNLASVDVVITSDKSKWTRCAVVETGFEDKFNENATGLSRPPIRGEMRAHKSVDKNGKTEDDAGVDVADANLISSTGMGWFPGYAINVETGERLNMAFGESSTMVDQNGNDMIWNPTYAATNEYGVLKAGGLHFVYVFNHNNYASESGTLNPAPNLMPAYDGGKYISEKLKASSTEAVVSSSNFYPLKQVWRDCIWANIPRLAKDRKMLENDVTIKLRVAKPYQKFYACNAYDYQYKAVPSTKFISVDSVNNTAVAESPKNYNNPRYSFSTKDLATLLGNSKTAKNALDLINVVPNPYYAYSEYEETQIDNLVKITNLPMKCTVSIYTVSGTLIRRIEKDNDQTYLDWDLKNQSNIPIASGMYLVHIKTKIGGVDVDKTVKWFGALRPIDLNAF